MGLRVRKSINIGPLRLNLSKSGVGFSLGYKGIRFTKLADGRTRKTFSLPGTGLSYVSEGSKKNKSAKSKNIPDISNLSEEELAELENPSFENNQGFTLQWKYVIIGGVIIYVIVSYLLEQKGIKLNQKFIKDLLKQFIS